MATDTKAAANTNLLWTTLSTITLLITGTICKLFLLFTSEVSSPGLENFLHLLASREDVRSRKRGLLTLANHISTVDDPLIWGLLPYRYLLPSSCRWGLGSHDICYTINSFFSTYFMLGQVLPCHRSKYSRNGGLFQPTLTQAIRLLSSGPNGKPTPLHPEWPGKPMRELADYYDLDDLFANPTGAFTTTGSDRFPAPSADAVNSHAWVHVFPEGRIHQHEGMEMQYFRWGVARLILEADVCPTVVPMWIEGTDKVMDDSRGWIIPRVWGRKITVVFGDAVADGVWEGFRQRWSELVREEWEKEHGDVQEVDGELLNEELRYGSKAQGLRMEVALVVREQILRLRRARGWPEEDPKRKIPSSSSAASKENGCRKCANGSIETWSDGVWT